MVEKYQNLQIMQMMSQWQNGTTISLARTEGDAEAFKPEVLAKPSWADTDSLAKEARYDSEHEDLYISPAVLLESLVDSTTMLEGVTRFSISTTTLDTSVTFEGQKRGIEDAKESGEITEDQYEEYLQIIENEEYPDYDTKNTHWIVRLHFAEVNNVEAYKKLVEPLPYRDINDHKNERPVQYAQVSYPMVFVETHMDQKVDDDGTELIHPRVQVSMPYHNVNKATNQWGFGELTVEFLPHLGVIQILFDNHVIFKPDPFIVGSYAVRIDSDVPGPLDEQTASAHFGDHNIGGGWGKPLDFEFAEPFLWELIETASNYASDAMKLAATAVLIQRNHF